MCHDASQDICHHLSLHHICSGQSIPCHQHAHIELSIDTDDEHPHSLVHPVCECRSTEDGTQSKTDTREERGGQERELRVYLGVTRHDTMRHDTTRHDTTRHETQESILVSRDMCLGVLRHMPRRVVSPLPPSVYLCLSGRVAAHVSWCRDVSCRVCRLLCLCVCRVRRVMCACGVATYICLDITWSCRLVTHPCLVVSCVSASVCVCGCLRRTRIAYRSHVLSCRACLHLSLYVRMSLHRTY